MSQRTACGSRGGAWGSCEESKQHPQKEQTTAAEGANHSCRRSVWDPAEPRRTGSLQVVQPSGSSRPRLAGGGVQEIRTGPRLPPCAGQPAWLRLYGAAEGWALPEEGFLPARPWGTWGPGSLYPLQGVLSPDCVTLAGRSAPAGRCGMCGLWSLRVRAWAPGAQGEGSAGPWRGSATPARSHVSVAPLSCSARAQRGGCWARSGHAPTAMTGIEPRTGAGGTKARLPHLSCTVPAGHAWPLRVLGSVCAQVPGVHTHTQASLQRGAPLGMDVTLQP